VNINMYTVKLGFEPYKLNEQNEQNQVN